MASPLVSTFLVDTITDNKDGHRLVTFISPDGEKVEWGSPQVQGSITANGEIIDLADFEVGDTWQCPWQKVV